MQVLELCDHPTFLDNMDTHDLFRFCQAQRPFLLLDLTKINCRCCDWEVAATMTAFRKEASNLINQPIFVTIWSEF
ncbi:hypothetical protein RIF29_13188 [Crotalaria pallida]|uniref:Uncharacterized protein n=1 Tax=Crotalaria pallida TaxID=3830 RepID=A0AAN9INZ4_CROPI